MLSKTWISLGIINSPWLDMGLFLLDPEEINLIYNDSQTVERKVLFWIFVLRVPYLKRINGTLTRSSLSVALSVRMSVTIHFLKNASRNQVIRVVEESLSHVNAIKRHVHLCCIFLLILLFARESKHRVLTMPWNNEMLVTSKPIWY